MRAPAARAGGFAYLGLMFLVSLLGLTAAMASVVWSTAQRRENERQLVFAGEQFAAAIERRHARPESAGAYPRRLEDMLGDTLHRELRQVYADPMTGRREWGLLRDASGGIFGVFSLSEEVPLQQTRFIGARSYRDWRFIAPSAGELTQASGDVVPLTAGAAASSVVVTASSPFAIRPARPRPGVVPPIPGTAPPAEPATPAQEGPAAEPLTSPLAARPTQDDLRSRTPEACDRIEAFDQRTCGDVAVRSGDEAGNACRDSAVRRTVACSLRQDGPLPPLLTRAP